MEIAKNTMEFLMPLSNQTKSSIQKDMVQLPYTKDGYEYVWPDNTLYYQSTTPSPANATDGYYGSTDCNDGTTETTRN